MVCEFQREEERREREAGRGSRRREEKMGKKSGKNGKGKTRPVNERVCSDCIVRSVGYVIHFHFRLAWPAEREIKGGQLLFSFFFPLLVCLSGLVNCIYTKWPGYRLRRWPASFKEKRRGERERLGVVRGGEKKKWKKKSGKNGKCVVGPRKLEPSTAWRMIKKKTALSLAHMYVCAESRGKGKAQAITGIEQKMKRVCKGELLVTRSDSSYVCH